MWWVVVAAVTLFVVMQLKGKKQLVSLQLPLGALLPSSPLPPLVRALSFLLYIASLLFLSWAFVHCLVGSGPLGKFLRPVALSAPPVSPTQSRVLFFVIDRSGSMAEPMPDSPQRSKMSGVKEGLKQCITTIDDAGGQDDFIGLMTFSRAARIDVPLSRDREFLEERVKAIITETVDRLNGTSIGYAIFKSVSLIVACRSFSGGEEVKKGSPIGNTIVLVTDGLEEPNPADRNHPFRSMRTFQALDYARENNVRVNYVNVDKNSYQQLSLEERSRLIDAIEATGGQYFEVTVGQSLGQVMSQIAQSVQATPSMPPLENRAELAFWLLVCALMSASVSRLLETVVMRVVR